MVLPKMTIYEITAITITNFSFYQGLDKRGSLYNTGGLF